MDTPKMIERFPLLLLGGLLISAAVLADERTAEGGTPPGRDLAAQLGGELTAAGWVGIEEADGTVTYRRPAESAPAGQTAGQSSRRDSTSRSEDSALADSLRTTLNDQGWTAIPAEDGGVYYLPPQPEDAPAPRLAQDLRSQLDALGWAHSVAEDGSLIYRRPGAAEQSAETVAEDVAGPDSLADRWRRMLENQGWTAVPADGDVYYLPPGPKPAPPASTPAPPMSTPGLAGRLREQLEAQGWERSVAEDGSQIYRRPGVTARPAEVFDAAPSRTLADELRQKLEASGWTAVSDGKGGVYYLPPESTAPVAPSQAPVEALSRSEGEAPLPTASEGVAAGAQDVAPELVEPQPLATAPPVPPPSQIAPGETDVAPKIAPPDAQASPRTARPGPESTQVAPHVPGATRAPRWLQAGRGGPAYPPGWSAQAPPGYGPHNAWQSAQPRSLQTWGPSPWGGSPFGAYRYR